MQLQFQSFQCCRIRNPLLKVYYSPLIIWLSADFNVTLVPYCPQCCTVCNMHTLHTMWIKLCRKEYIWFSYSENPWDDGCLFCTSLAYYGTIEVPRPMDLINKSPCHRVNLHKKVSFDSSNPYMWTGEWKKNFWLDLLFWILDKKRHPLSGV